MKEIKLGQTKKGKYSHLVALVDDEDFDFLMQWNWYATPSDNTFYATRKIRTNNGIVTIFMHRIIMDAKIGETIDHENGEGLQNFRNNLRKCTIRQNALNAIKRKKASSKYRGVTINNNGGKKWRISVTINRKTKFIGKSDSEIDAALIFNAKAKELYGEFARLNVVPPVRFYQKPMLIPII